MKYQLETEYFTATTTSEMLQFQDLSYLNYSGYNGSTPWGAVIGNVVLSAVPEPTTVVAGALLLLPFGMSTLRILRKSKPRNCVPKSLLKQFRPVARPA